MCTVVLSSFVSLSCVSNTIASYTNVYYRNCSDPETKAFLEIFHLLYLDITNILLVPNLKSDH